MKLIDVEEITEKRYSILDICCMLIEALTHNHIGGIKELIPSPLNYTGGKFKLLPQILPHFPKNINTFVDLFCGGCNVGINVNSKKTIYIDICEPLILLYGNLQQLDTDQTFRWIYEIINKYELSLTVDKGYNWYGCVSNGGGLSKYNKDKFLRLRDDFNNYNYRCSYYYIMLYVLIVYAFNNQIRFNSKGEFNLPVGKRDFNQKMQYKLLHFINRIKSQNCKFWCLDFKYFEIDRLTSNDFVYADPPYLISHATYNDTTHWNEESEKELFAYLDKLTDNNIRFALSNILYSKGKENILLAEWLKSNYARYRVVHLKQDYTHSSYCRKDRKSADDEVLILNY